MLNFDKLNGVIVSRETLARIQNDSNVKECYQYGETVFLKGWRIILQNDKVYSVYTRKWVLIWASIIVANIY